MYSPIHAAGGVLLVEHLPNAPTAFLVGAASHYLLDAIPHGDSHFGAWLTSRDPLRRIIFVETLDLGLAALVVIALGLQSPANQTVKLAVGAIGAVTPDLLWGGRFLLDRAGWRIPLLTSFLHHHDRWHGWGHAKAAYDLPFVVGLAIQVGLVIAVLLWRLQ